MSTFSANVELFFFTAVLLEVVSAFCIDNNSGKTSSTGLPLAVRKSSSWSPDMIWVVFIFRIWIQKMLSFGKTAVWSKCQKFTHLSWTVEQMSSLNLLDLQSTWPIVYNIFSSTRWYGCNFFNTKLRSTKRLGSELYLRLQMYVSFGIFVQDVNLWKALRWPGAVDWDISL